MDEYDPLQTPDPETWLATDEAERMEIVAEYHAELDDHGGLDAGGARTHVALHVVIENQIAMGDQTPVREKIRQLMAQGLDRHEAIHCVATALLELMFDTAQPPNSTGANAGEARYFAAVKRLNAQKWRRLYGRRPVRHLPGTRDRH